jgi:hypothetical protein
LNGSTDHAEVAAPEPAPATPEAERAAATQVEKSGA